MNRNFTVLNVENLVGSCVNTKPAKGIQNASELFGDIDMLVPKGRPMY